MAHIEQPHLDLDCLPYSLCTFNMTKHGRNMLKFCRRKLCRQLRYMYIG